MQLVSEIDNVIRHYNINTLITHYVNDTNQAHREVAQAVIAAGRKINNILMIEPVPPASRGWVPFRPQLYVDISDVIDIKMKSLYSYASQIEKFGSEWVEGVFARSKMRGWEIGTSHAEVFEIVRLKYDNSFNGS